MNAVKPTILVHGGAWDIPNEAVEDHLTGVEAAAETGMAVLLRAGSALDAVEAAVNVMEESGVFNAGRGSHLNAEGEVELDAIIMDGETLNAGSVAAVTNIIHPISLARKVMEETRHVLLVGEGARKFAAAHGFRLSRTEELVSARELKRYRELRRRTVQPKEFYEPSPPDTVGAVALDSHRNLAAGTSTGGQPKKMPGRVGDSPIVGAGAYADNSLGACSATGWGESIMKTVLSKLACDLMGEGSTAQSACRKAIRLLKKKVDGRGGLVAIDHNGRHGVAYSTPRMARALMTAGMGSPKASI